MNLFDIYRVVDPDRMLAVCMCLCVCEDWLTCKQTSNLYVANTKSKSVICEKNWLLSYLLTLPFDVQIPYRKWCNLSKGSFHALIITEKEHTQARPSPYVSHFHRQLTIKQDCGCCHPNFTSNVQKKSRTLIIIQSKLMQRGQPCLTAAFSPLLRNLTYS